MIADLEPYPTMTASGVPWLGEVPSHWKVRRLKSAVSNVIEPGGQREVKDLYVALEHVESWTGRIRSADPDVTIDSQVKRFSSGDVLFGKLRPYLAKVVRPRDSGVCVGEFLVLRPHNENISGPFLEQMLRSKPIIDAVNGSTFGAKMPRADWKFVGGMSVPVPTLDEQAHIVRFLDFMDRRIHRYIRAKQKLIKLLEEQRQSIIHRAVTRGIDSNVRLKPSGIDWLGDIPEHWEAKRAKVYFREVDERSSTGTEELLSVSHITGVTPRSEKNVTMFEPESYVGHKLCRPGDIAINTMWAWAGAMGVSNRLGMLSPSYAVYRPWRDGLYQPDFIDVLLRTPTYVGQYVARSTGIRKSRLRLYPEKFLRIELLHPPIAEQTQIADYVKSHTSTIRNEMDSAERAIVLIREFQMRLVSDVVTGKVDVGTVAAQLPEETGEDEPLDVVGESIEDFDDDEFPDNVEEVEA